MGSSLNAMARECEEETGIRVFISRWVEVGKLVSDKGNWSVDIYTARMWTLDLGPGVIWADTEVVMENPDRLHNHEIDRAIMVPVELLHTLKMAPHGASLALAALERLRDGSIPIMTFEHR